MADDDILSELERFEQEMKELVADSQPSYETQASVVSALATPAPATEISNISTAQQSPSISAAPLVGPSTYVPPKPVIATAASTHVQSQISAAPAPASSSQWLNNGIGHTPVALPPVTPVATSTSTPFSYSSQYPQQPFTVPQYTAQVPKQYPSAPQPSLSAVHTPVYPYTSMYQPTVGVGGIYSLPQQQQAQQLFQKDAQTITPEALESVKAALASSESEHKADTKKKAIPRKAAGQSWEDPTLAEWPENDFRLFCGDLGNEVNDEVLTKAFSRFPTFNMARVVRDKRTGKTKGYGFVSFSNPSDLANALKEMNGKYVGNRPIKLRKSNWKERTDYEALTKHKHKKAKHSKKHMPNR